MTGKTEKTFSPLDSVSLDILKFVLALLLVVLAWVGYYARHYEGLALIDSLDTAQVAQNLAGGRGFVTNFLRPVSLAAFPGTGPIPDFYSPPAQVLLLGGLFRLFGARGLVVIGSSLVWGMLGSLGVFTLVWRRLGYHWGLLALLLVGLAPGTVEIAFSGLGVAFSGVLFLVFFALLARESRPGFPVLLALSGLWGLLALNDFGFALLSPLAVFSVWKMDRDRRGAGIFALAAFLVVSPWLVRNLLVAGNPFASLRWSEFYSWTRSLPGNRIFRDPAWSAGMVPAGEIPEKFLVFGRLLNPYWVSLGGLPVLGLYLLSLFASPRPGRFGKASRLAGLLLAGASVKVLLFDPNSLGTLMAFYPALTLAALDFLASRLPASAPARLRKRASAVAVLAAVCLPGLASAYLGLGEGRYFPPVLDRVARENLKSGSVSRSIRELVKPDETVISDSPWAVAWFTGRSSLWIPWELSQIRELREFRPLLDFLHLTPMIHRYPPGESPGPWQEIYSSGRVPSGLGFEKGIILPGQETLLGSRVFERLDLE